MIMKIFATFVALICFAAVSFANDGTISVLKTTNETTTQPTVAAAAPVVPVAANACCEEAQEARVVKLSPWTVRRLNRVADRQEAREARNCCCNKSCKCSDDCNPKTLVVESRKKTCNCR